MQCSDADLGHRGHNPRCGKGYADGFAAGVRAMREAAAKIACEYCREGLPVHGGHHHYPIGGDVPCYAEAIRSLPDPPAEAE